MAALTSPFGTARVIATDEAARGVAGKRGQTLEQLLDAGPVQYELSVCRGPSQALDLAREAAQKGRYLVAAGNDLLVHEVLNGMLGEEPKPGSDFVLAIVPGTGGSDFIRTFGIPPDPADAVSHLGGERHFSVDAGKVTFSRKGRRVVRLFANMAEAGIGAGIVRRAALLPDFLGRGADLLSFWMSLATFKPVMGRVTLDKRVLDVPLCNLVVANGQFFRDGMRLAPKAHPSDGRFDALVMKGKKSEYVAALTKARRGDHVPDPSIREYMAAKVEVFSDRPLELHADGKFLGHTPATFEIVPNAFRLKI